MTNRILITGCAGFIGSTLTDKLLTDGYQVVGVDNFNEYYDPKVKEKNLENALKSEKFILYREDILDFDKISAIFQKEKPNKIIHLAARAGVRPSIADPMLYGQVNVLGTVNVLKLSANNKVEQFIFGSSSSVYGQSPNLPFAEDDLCQNIISPYGSSKRSAEFFVESFYHNFSLRSVILRLFTVYGPRGRPDMAPALFTSAALSGSTIKQFGDGSSSRDYTYIDDIVEGIVKSLAVKSNFEIINLGNNHPIKLSDFISTVEMLTGKKINVEKISMQNGDVEKTWADISKAKKLMGWKPKTDFASGQKKYINSL